MKSNELKEKYLSFFEKHNHKRVESASLIPENDPTVLFTTAGMHPLVPFLLGQPHPLGKRITNAQKCIRTGDIDEVGDDTHLTFFEMLGNWSLGDYFKEEAIKLSYKFLTEELNLPEEKLGFTCFKGDNDAPKDNEAANVWKSLGVSEKRIAFLDKKDNWWGPAGQTGPCGPDTEMFYWVGDKPAPEIFNPKDETWVEIWNDVFMQYNKTQKGTFEPLKQTNVDTGLGVERVAMVLEGKTNVYQIESLSKIMNKIKETVNIQNPTKDQEKSLRIITDHIRTATFILGDERDITPSNVDQGYILRKILRRIIRHMMLLDEAQDTANSLKIISKTIIDMYKDQYDTFIRKEKFILDEIQKETNKFSDTIERALKEIEKKMKSCMLKDIKTQINQNLIAQNLIIWKNDEKYNNSKIIIDSKWLFNMFQSFGMPLEMTFEEIENSYKKQIDNKVELIKEFEQAYKKHQELSRKGAEQKFKGGLADDSQATTALHTATHLLNQALRNILSKDIRQKGSNITPDRLRFDFNFERKVTSEELKQIEDMVNEQINSKFEVTKEKMKLQDALKSGAQAEFGARYPEEVWVYTIGNFSKEICTGPHVNNTKELGRFKIKKEQSSAAGIRRIKAILIKN